MRRARRVRKVMPVLGGFDQSNYRTERLWATAEDGVRVPVSLVYRKDCLKRDGSNPLLLDGCAQPACREERALGCVFFDNSASFPLSPEQFLPHGPYKMRGLLSYLLEAAIKLCIHARPVLELVWLTSCVRNQTLAGAGALSSCVALFIYSPNPHSSCLQPSNVLTHARGRYGAYEACSEPSFSLESLPLLDRGFVYAHMCA